MKRPNWCVGNWEQRIDRFARFCAELTVPGSVVLDAGAGLSPYKEYFTHCKYISVDNLADTDISKHKNLDFVCSLDALPFPSDHFDVILLTEVLEHLPEPQKVLTELYRVLKKGGRVFFSVPLLHGLHQMPHDYFRFTENGLRHLVKNSGFEVMFIDARSKWFSEFAIMCRGIPYYLVEQTDIFWVKVLGIFLSVPSLFFYWLFIQLDHLDKTNMLVGGYFGVLKK